MVIIAVSILMDDIREMVGVIQEMFCYEAVDLEGLPLDPYPTVAFAVVGSYHMPGGGIAQHIACRAYRTIRKDIVEGVALLVETMTFSHTLSF